MGKLLKQIKSLAYLDKPTEEQFKKIRSEPAVFKNSIENEHALNLNFDTIKTSIDNININLRRSLCNKSEKITTTLHNYIDYITKNENLVQCYTENPMTGETFFKDYYPSDKLYCLEMDANYDPELAKFFSCPSFMGDWYDKYLPLFKRAVLEGKRHTWFFIGPKDTLSEMHTDHDSIHTTIQQCCGEKRFFTIKPKQQIWLEERHSEQVIESLRFNIIDDKLEVTSILDNDQVEDIFKDLEDIDIYVNDLKKGDVIYIPSMTGHCAVSLSNSIGVSRDFIDDTNLDKYLFSCLFSSHVFEVAHSLIPYSLLQNLQNEYESIKA